MSMDTKQYLKKKKYKKLMQKTNNKKLVVCLEHKQTAVGVV